MTTCRGVLGGAWFSGGSPLAAGPEPSRGAAEWERGIPIWSLRHKHNYPRLPTPVSCPLAPVPPPLSLRAGAAHINPESIRPAARGRPWTDSPRRCCDAAALPPIPVPARRPGPFAGGRARRLTAAEGGQTREALAL